MGFKISWLAVEHVGKAELLASLRFRDTGEEDEVNEEPFSAAELGNGWSLIWANDFSWATEQTLTSVPAGCRVIRAQIHEGIMYASATGGVGNVEQWSIVHDAQVARTHLSVNGTPPFMEAVRDKLLAEQAADDSGGVDYVFDVPVEIAARLTGFRHDEWDLRGGPRPRYTAVVPNVTRQANG